MVRTEWLNLSVARLRRKFAGRCNCDLGRSLPDLRDTAIEADKRGHRTRCELLHRLISKAEIGCVGEITQRRLA